MAGVVISLPLAVEFDLDGHQAQLFVLDGADLHPLAGAQGLGAIQPYEAGLGVQQYLGAPGVDAEKAGREADAELQHLDPDGAGRGEVAQLVDHHQDQQQRGQSADCEQEGFHWRRPVLR